MLMKPRLHPFSTSFLLLCTLVLCFFAPVAAQTEVTGAIRGQVFDTQRGTPLAGVIVQIINEDTEVPNPAKTDANGNFSKQGLPAGNYYIRVNTAGYAPFELKQRIRIMNTDDVKPLPIPLQSLMAAAKPPDTPNTPPPDTPGTPPTPMPNAAPSPNRLLGTVETFATESINTTDARLAGSFGKEKLKSLPVGSSSLTRSFDEFALLLPGVALPPQTSGGIAGPGVGPGVGSSGQFAVNGLRSRGNNFTIDGSDNNDEDIGVRRQGFFALVPQSIESVEEYQVTTALLPAQYGRNFGAFVNAVSRSGSRKFHGDIYGFFNSSQLNARNAFDTANGNARTPLTAGNNQPVQLDGQPLTTLNESGGKDSFTLGQGGFTFGGPLTPARASGRGVFFFVSGERQVLNASRELSFAVPTVEERGTLGSGASGLFFDPLTCNNFSDLRTCAPGGPLDFYFPTSLQGDAVFSLFPFPNNPSGVYGRNTLTQVLPASARGLILSARSDADFVAFRATHRLSGRYNYTDDKRDIPSVGGAIFSALRPLVRTNNFALSLNSQINERTTNELRASYGRTRLNFDDINLTPQGRPELRRSVKLPNTPFLLNAPYLINNTLPQCSLGGSVVDCFNRGGRIVANTGTVRFDTGGTVETGLGSRSALGPLGQVVIAGYSPIGVDVFSFPQSRVNNTYQLADTLSFTRGGHRLSFGGDFRRAELNSDLPRNSRTLLTFYGAPRIRFNGTSFRFDGFFRPTDLAAAQAASGTFQTLAAPGASSNIGLRYYQNYLFGQDEWRVNEQLSISYGLRYEYTTPPREVNGIIENTFSAPEINMLLPGLNSFIAGRSQLFDPDRNNFAPRLGVAYSLRPSTVIRAGFGRYFDQIIGAVVSQSRNTFPSFLTLNSSGGLGGIRGGSFDIFNFASPTNGISSSRGFRPYTTPGTLNTLNPAIRDILIPPGLPLLQGVIEVVNSEFPGGLGATLPARDLSSPEAYHYGVTVEQQLSNDIIVSLGYVGTQGRHLLRFTTPNLGANVTLLPLSFTRNTVVIINGVPTITPIVPDFGGFAVPPGVRLSSDGTQLVGGRPIPSVGSVNIFETSANSRYNGIQAQVRGRFAQSLQFQFAYTLSEVEDDVSDVFDLAGASALPQNSLTRAGEYAHANFDAHHRFAYNFVYDVPSPGSNHSRAYRALLGGLQIAGTGYFQTGQPFTVNSIFDVNLDGNLTDRLNILDGLEQTGDRRQPLRIRGDATGLLAPVGQDGRVPRNSFRSGNVLDLNLSAIKSFAITETQRIVVRVDVFNFINRKNYGTPVRFLEAPGFGQATETVTPGRRVQFSLRYSF